MQVDTTKITAEVYAKNEEKCIYYIKIAIPSLGMYMNSFTVRPSNKYEEMWFQTPAFLVGRKWTKPIEFRGDSELQDLIKDAALRAVEQYNNDQTQYSDIDINHVPDFGS